MRSPSSAQSHAICLSMGDLSAGICRFGFSRWAVSLNSKPPGLEALLPPSDMRWRKDVGLLEEGKYEQVGSSLASCNSAACCVLWQSIV